VPNIPERQPLGDPFVGSAIQIDGMQALALVDLQRVEILHSGDMIVRYGVRYLGKPHLSVVPGLIAVDYGEMLTGEAAWEFLTKRSNLYPRAEVFGYRNDGRDEMITIKNLDLVQPIEVLVFADKTATSPVAKPTALIAGESDTNSLPPRLLQYLPRYDSVAAWQAQDKP
jgi:hypothetical protein